MALLAVDFTDNALPPTGWRWYGILWDFHVVPLLRVDVRLSFTPRGNATASFETRNDDRDGIIYTQQPFGWF